ncbi:MAG: hypothetical protein ACJ72N_06905 [Labedaea sp.]
MVDADLRDAVARRLGMKPREIVDVVEYDDAVLVTTHDGVQSRVDEHGVHPVAVPPALPRNPATGEVTPTVGERMVAAAVTVIEDEAQRCPECRGTGRRRDADGAGEQPVPVVAPTITASPAGSDADDVAGGEVPDGNAEQVQTWVGDDPDRARRALDAERQREQPRSGLTGHLEKVVAKAEQA